MNPLDPQSWLLKAERDLALAKLAQAQMPNASDLICYHCQQAAEKYLKALIVHHGLALRKSHDLEELLDILIPSEPGISDEHYDEAVKIKVYAVGIRYPSHAPDPSNADVLEALASAEFFKSFAASIVLP